MSNHSCPETMIFLTYSSVARMSSHAVRQSINSEVGRRLVRGKKKKKAKNTSSKGLMAQWVKSAYCHA